MLVAADVLVEMLVGGEAVGAGVVSTVGNSLQSEGFQRNLKVLICCAGFLCL